MLLFLLLLSLLLLFLLRVLLFQLQFHGFDFCLIQIDGPQVKKNGEVLLQNLQAAIDSKFFQLSSFRK